MSFEEMQKQLAGMLGDMKVPVMDGLKTSKEVETESGGGLVKVVIGTNGSLAKIAIDPLLLDETNVNHLEQLLIAAVNDGRSKWDDLAKKEAIATVMNNMPEGLDMQKAMAEAMKMLKK